MKKKVWLSVLTAVVLLLESAGTVSAVIIPRTGEGQLGKEAVVLCESLTIREEPNAASKAVDTLKYGKRFAVLSESDGWAEVILSDDVDASPAGWVNADYIVIDPEWYKTNDKTPVYAWDDVSALKVAMLEADTTLPILKNDKEWVIVSLRGATGWIHKTSAD